jgi:hypothetical protein
VNSPLLWLLSLLLITTAQARLDLTPTPTEYVAEGITFQRLIFRHADKTSVSYEPPRGWSGRGEGDRFQMIPAGATNAEASIRAQPLAAPQPVDEKSAVLLKEQFLKNLPSGSQTISVLKEEQNPVVLENKPSYAVTASYQVMGQTFIRSELFINLHDTQLSFRFSATKTEFEKFHQVFRGSILSWHWLEPPAKTPSAAPSQSP